MVDFHDNKKTITIKVINNEKVIPQTCHILRTESFITNNIWMMT